MDRISILDTPDVARAEAVVNGAMSLGGYNSNLDIKRRYTDRPVILLGMLCLAE